MEEHLIKVTRASTMQDFAVGRQLFGEYANGLDIDLEFQGFQQELDALQDHYGQPDTCLLIARDSQGTCGCVGVRRFDAQNCEMKRLFVREKAQGLGVGRLLAREAIAFATKCGYQAMILDSLPTMTRAVSLYRSLGFREVPAYYSNPVEGTLYMELRLDAKQRSPQKPSWT
jgi:putative acetyltransferase